MGNNRTDTHKRAKTGPGGVSVVNSENTDILFVELKPKKDGDSLFVCVCYLPQYNSSRKVNATEFFDVLLDKIYTY